jgi:hypothetical protein
MLMEFQNASPRKCLRIRALRSTYRREAGTGTRNNFHSACSVYLMRRLPPSFRSLFAICRGISSKFTKIRTTWFVVVPLFKEFGSNGTKSSELLKTESYRKPDAGKARREV